MARIKNLSGAPKTQIERGGSGAHLFRDRRLAGEPLVEVGILHVNDILELLQLLLAERAEVVAGLSCGKRTPQEHISSQSTRNG